jgi:hypothetical protein
VQDSIGLFTDVTRISERPVVEPDALDELLSCLANLRAQTIERRRAIERGRNQTRTVYAAGASRTGSVFS